MGPSPKGFLRAQLFPPCKYIIPHVFESRAHTLFSSENYNRSKTIFFSFVLFILLDHVQSVCPFCVPIARTRAIISGIFSAINFRGLSRFGFLRAQIFFLLPLIYIYRFVIYNRAISLGKKIYINILKSIIYHIPTIKYLLSLFDYNVYDASDCYTLYAEVKIQRCSYFLLLLHNGFHYYVYTRITIERGIRRGK